VTLDQGEAGLWRTTIEAKELGLWRASDGKLTALANAGPANPKEFDEVTSTTDWLAPIINATGGDGVRIDDGAGIHLPRVVGVQSTDTYHGDNWIGLKIPRSQRSARDRRVSRLCRTHRSSAARR
jgi:hypothetical protein